MIVPLAPVSPLLFIKPFNMKYENLILKD